MKRGAFTIVELIIVLGIIMALFAISAPFFPGLIEGTRLTTAAKNVTSILRTARGYAVDGSQSYYVVFDTMATPNEYYIYDGAEVLEKKYKLPPGVWFYKPNYTIDPIQEAIEFTNDTAWFKSTGELEDVVSNAAVYVSYGKSANAKYIKIDVERTSGRAKIEE